MKLSRDTMRLYAVTDRAWLGGRSLENDVEAALRGGATLLQLREKSLGDDEFLAEAKAILPICRRYGVPLIINDNVKIAMLARADGVHLGQSDENPESVRRLMGDGFIIGVSARTVFEARAAEAAGADYIGVGAMFPTSTKSDTRHITPSALADITASVSIPAVAIGGISESNMRELSGTGVAGVAVVSAIFAAGGGAEIESAARRLLSLSREIAT